MLLGLVSQFLGNAEGAMNWLYGMNKHTYHSLAMPPQHFEGNSDITLPIITNKDGRVTWIESQVFVHICHLLRDDGIEFAPRDGHAAQIARQEHWLAV